MIIRAVRDTIISCALFGLVTSLHAAQGKQGKKVPTASSSTPSGVELYKQHCVACHGIDLQGSGPVPSPYRVPPDLTTLTRRHGGKFPDAYVSDVLRNGVILPAHGPAEMPVWGADFRLGDRLGEHQVTLRITNLINYIKSRQVK
jgi:mono/diheme cytochrome c family protein